MSLPRVAKATVKILLLIVLIAALRLYVFEHWIDLEQMQTWILRQGILAPLLFSVVLMLTMVLYLPSALFVGLGAISCGMILGPLLSLAGLTLGASIAFLIGRRVAREAAEELLARKFALIGRLSLSSAAAKGFPFICGLRLASFFDTATNYALGTTRVRFWSQLAGTVLGFLPPVCLVSLSFQAVWQARSIQEMTIYNPFVWSLPALRGVGVLVLFLLARAKPKAGVVRAAEEALCRGKTAGTDSREPGAFPCQTR